MLARVSHLCASASMRARHTTRDAVEHGALDGIANVIFEKASPAFMLKR